jgi:hypothetical protein
MIEIVRRTQRNVKRWSSGEMALPWTAAGMPEAEKQFRRIIGYRDLATLVVAIEGDNERRRQPGTGEAGRHASFDHAADETDVRRALPNRDAAGQLARIGAVESDSNHADQLLIVLAHADVGACDAAGRTVETLLRAAQQKLTNQAPRQRMHVDDLPESHDDIDVSTRRECFGVGQVTRSLRRSSARAQTRALGRDALPDGAYTAPNLDQGWLICFTSTRASEWKGR